MRLVPFFALLGAVTAANVFVMMPLTMVSTDGEVVDPDSIRSAFAKLKSIDVDGVMFDVWWGIVERNEPMTYNWNAYEQIVDMAQQAGLRIQAVMSFHQCGGNVGDACNISLPLWVLNVSRTNPDIFYKDAEGDIDPEYLSLGIDNLEILAGRSPLTIYTDFVQSFLRTFQDSLGTTIVEIQVGLGPAGELRYPSYQSKYWNFPGIGEFQCYDKYMLADLQNASTQAGHPEWGHAGPNDAGKYNNVPSNTNFFRDGGSFDSDYGKFFLGWYSSSLIAHGDRILKAVRTLLNSTPAIRDSNLSVTAKISGIHWWYKTSSHAAELTAGYYNVYNRDGYSAITNMFASHGVQLDFTMLEMTDNDNQNCASGPEELVHQAFSDAINSNIAFSGENALPRYDEAAYQHIISVSSQSGHMLKSFTYLRWGDTLQQQDNWSTFANFVSSMHNLGSPTAIRRHLAEKMAPRRNRAYLPQHQHALQKNH